MSLILITVAIAMTAPPNSCRLTTGCSIELASVEPTKPTPKPLTPIVTGNVPDDCRGAGGGGVNECVEKPQGPPRRSSLLAAVNKSESWDKGSKKAEFRSQVYAKFVPNPNPPPKQTFGTGTRWNSLINVGQSVVL